MSMYNEFISSILPGNYALTKSMELTKVQDAGTLWYTKKFLTLYYYIFLSNDIMTMAYQRAVTEIFDNYIDSLPDAVKDSAREYFYPKNDAINFKSSSFNLFSSFAGQSVFETEEERTAYYQSARRYYFSFLMGSGGQTGIKKMLKEAVQTPGFVYSHSNIDNIILMSAISVCTREANTLGKITDNSVKYILSSKTMDKACEMAAANGFVTEAEVSLLNANYPHPNPKYRVIEGDMVAFIRNERQILYYYGYFHSKSTGAADFEFSSLTPIGELALSANASEFLAIWEHQKIKMISQPATADINQVPISPKPIDSLKISYTPYTDILGHLSRRGSLTLDEYKYIVSRKKHTLDESAWISEENDIVSHIDDIKAYVDSLGRKRDRENDDARKELLKYILGLRGDLPTDKDTNPLSSLKFNRSTVTVESPDRLALTYKIYKHLNDYKLKKHISVIEDAERDLAKRYAMATIGKDCPIDARVKIYWDLYNIHQDNLIMLCTMLNIACAALKITDLDTVSRDDLNHISDYMLEHFKTLLKSAGLRTQAAVKSALQKAISAMKDDDYSAYIAEDSERGEVTLARYKSEKATDLRAKIESISSAASVSETEKRERNANLVTLIKSYYMSCYAVNNMLKCECCGNETFITAAGEPYVEFHHLIPFSIAHGPDHYLNLFAICPGCHRRIHYLAPAEKGKTYRALSENNYLRLTFVERLKELKRQGLLRSFHLEFLSADNAITLEEYNQIAS